MSRTTHLLTLLGTLAAVLLIAQPARSDGLRNCVGLRCPPAPIVNYYERSISAGGGASSSIPDFITRGPASRSLMHLVPPLPGQRIIQPGDLTPHVGLLRRAIERYRNVIMPRITAAAGGRGSVSHREALLAGIGRELDATAITLDAINRGIPPTNFRQLHLTQPGAGRQTGRHTYDIGGPSDIDIDVPVERRAAFFGDPGASSAISYFTALTHEVSHYVFRMGTEGHGIVPDVLGAPSMATEVLSYAVGDLARAALDENPTLSPAEEAIARAENIAGYVSERALWIRGTKESRHYSFAQDLYDTRRASGMTPEQAWGVVQGAAIQGLSGYLGISP